MPRTSYHRLTLALLLLSCLFTLQAAPPVSSQSQTNRLYMPFVGTPPPLSQLTTFGGSLIYHTTANGYAYVAQEQGLSIYRVADLASPQLVGKLRLKGELRSIVVAGTRLFATNDYFSLLAWSPDGRRLLLDTAQSQAGLQWMHDARFKDQVNHDLRANQRTLFQQGKLAFMQGTPGIVAE